MNTSLFEPQISISIEVVERQLVTLPISIQLQPGVDKPVPGQPGKTAGSLVLIKDASGSFLLLVSTGLPGKTSAESFRSAGGAIARWLMENKVSDATLKASAFDPQGVNNAVDYLCEGIWLGAFQFKKYKKSDDQPNCTLYLEGGKSAAALRARLENVQKITFATNLARQIIHEPANVINPQTLSELAEALAQKYGFKCTVIDSKQLEELKAGALLAVGQGSKTPARLIVLEYPGQNPEPGTDPVVLVGKAVTFDTGGYSLKGVDHIVGMKFDKGGGVAVLCSLVAAASLKLKQPVVGIIPAVENMVSEKAYRPDDILISMSGKSIEIITTDAEGRLILADALTYAQKTFKPKVLIDVATLTGGVIIALGHVRAGILCNNESLTSALMASGEATHERLWPLPIDDEYAELIKSSEADIKNSGGREASTIIGAMFLKQFIEEGTIWAHVDIAGTGETEKNHPYCPKGPTGFGVRLFVDYLQKL